MGIGPSTKETTLFRFRDPLLDVVSNDEEVNLLGIIVSGTPQSNDEKVFCASRAALLAKALGAKGAIVSTDGWGNSNIDFVETLDALNNLKISTSGTSFVGSVGKFVVDSPNLLGVVDINKSQSGTETLTVGENNLDNIDAKKALSILKLKMRKEHTNEKVN